MKSLIVFWFDVLLIISAIFFTAVSCQNKEAKVLPDNSKNVDSSTSLMFPNESLIPRTSAGALIKYGRELIVHTANYLGPKGTVAALTNGMNCQNCHLNAGRQLYANSFLTVAATYPRFAARRGKVESVELRVNDCMERSLNGKKLAFESKEMQAMVAYIKWIGSNVKENSKPAGAGTQQLEFLERPADSVKGRILFTKNCTACHGPDGAGMIAPDSSGYLNPPLWGPNSYNVSAGMFRLSKLAGFIKNNMPLGSTYKAPQLTREQAWDIAAYVNSQPRDHKTFTADWPDISTKPMDHPFGPYKDHFSEEQHKYGPYKAIVDSNKKLTGVKTGSLK